MSIHVKPVIVGGLEDGAVGTVYWALVEMTNENPMRNPLILTDDEMVDVIARVEEARSNLEHQGVIEKRLLAQARRKQLKSAGQKPQG